MELRRAIADLAEVRGRLAGVQRFEGYSSWAAIASGLAAILAGVAQSHVIAVPRTAADHRLYLEIWLGCLVFALAVNYGAIVFWYLRHRSAHVDVQVRNVGMTILPAIAAGGVITVALLQRGLDTLLPGIWCAAYALGLFASRAILPKSVIAIAVGFGAYATLLLLAPGIATLAWWVMPIGFGFGQIAIGIAVALADRSAEAGVR